MNGHDKAVAEARLEGELATEVAGSGAGNRSEVIGEAQAHIKRSPFHRSRGSGDGNRSRGGDNQSRGCGDATEVAEE